MIAVESLSKNFVAKESIPGFCGAVRGLLLPKKKSIPAVCNLSFSVEPGERVAFIGPNGAGKSTVIKILTGILYPDKGTVKILGLTPWLDRKTLGFQLGAVFGQRTQLWYHLTPEDSFELLASIYEIKPSIYRERLKKLAGDFEIGGLLRKSVRQLSLGERMRCEIIASLLHAPKILFLDEPTIGLDVNAKSIIRSMLNHLSKENGTTLFLTSHDPADIEQVCERVLILDQGNLIRDTSLKNLREFYSKKKVLILNMEKKEIELDFDGINILKTSTCQLTIEIEVEKISVGKVIQEVLNQTALQDLTVQDSSMEEIIRHIYGARK